jgi:Flp pilus assembly protein TadG
MRYLPLHMFGPLGRRGVAAVEFALVAPVLLLIFIGTVEVATLYRTSAKLNAVAFNVAQMISLSGSPVSTSVAGVGQTAMQDICKGAAMGLAPFPTGGMTLNIASVTEEASPNALPVQPPANAAYSKSPTFDSWEWDGTVAANGTCSTVNNGDAIISGSPYQTVTNAAGTTPMLYVPCDNVIIVQASLTYPGIVGILLRSRPVLTQTAYVRWAFASPTTELTCSDCTVPATYQAPAAVCGANNPATN